MAFDLFIKNGLVIDPISKVHGKYDIAVDSGCVFSIHPSKEFGLENSAKNIIDARGCVVTPGLIDIHTHVFPNYTEIGIDADFVGVQQGVTTLVDAGSAGAVTFSKFIANVVEKNMTQVLAWINMKPHSISTDIYLENVNGPVYSLATTLSKFLALGISLDEVIATATMAPAAILRMSHEIGSLQVGRIADISILAMEDGVFEFIDSEKEVFTGHKLLQAKFAIKAGKVLKCR